MAAAKSVSCGRRVRRRRGPDPFRVREADEALASRLGSPEGLRYRDSEAALKGCATATTDPALERAALPGLRGSPEGLRYRDHGPSPRKGCATGTTEQPSSCSTRLWFRTPFPCSAALQGCRG